MQTSKMPIVVLISGNGSNLQAIINAKQENLPIEIKAVISSNPLAYGLQRAKAADLTHVSLSPQEFVDRSAYDLALTQLVNSFSPELIILAGFMRILGDSFLQQFKHKILNIHPSLLPKYPGLNTHQMVMAQGDSEHGCSVHFVDENLDSGPLIAQAAIKLQGNETLTMLKERVHQAEHFLYPTVINWFCQHRVALADQQVLLDQIPLPKSGLRFIIK
jgi:phosphoribosylglycinamide formyltransferase 1